MRIGCSSLAFPAYSAFDMKKLPQDIGIEIFYEWGGSTFWELMLEEVMDGRTGSFSIHAPYCGKGLDFTNTKDEDWLFNYLKEPFTLYHRFNAANYVIHTNGPLQEPLDTKRADELRKIVSERLYRFNELCIKEGVNMLVENLGFGSGLLALFDEQQFLKLFDDNHDLKCLIDTGHAAIEKFDMFRVQEILGARLQGYHLHDNNGIDDSHHRIETGCVNWRHFCEGAARFTPNAEFVFEYKPSAITSIQDIISDAQKLEKYADYY